MSTFPVYILDKDSSSGTWLLNHLRQIGVRAQWLPTLSDLLGLAESQPPTVCLIAIRPPVGQALGLITTLTQEPRFSRTAFILMGPGAYKHSAFEAGADDYLTTPPDVIELRKRVRLYLDRTELEERVLAETRITQEMEILGHALAEAELSGQGPMDEESVTLLEHAAALTRERNQLDLILRHAGQAISLVSPDGVLLYANPAWIRQIGQGAADLIGGKSLWPPRADSKPVNDDIAAAIEQAIPWQGEIRYFLPDGRKLDVAMTLTPAFDAVHELVGYVIVQSDVTQRKALDDLKSQFLSDAGLELRTPVTNIKMRQYLLQQAPVEQQTMHLQALERETDRLSRMLEAMIELSRIDGGLLRISLEATDLDQLLADAVVRYSPEAEEKGVTLSFTRNRTLPAVHLDPALFSRVIGIVLENAILYTPEAGHIAVRADQQTWTGGEFVTVEVKDTGIGIERDALPRVFERFFRTDRVRDSGYRGVGLGLAIAHEIMSRHQGSITVDSQINRGSTFTLWLPQREARNTNQP